MGNYFAYLQEQYLKYDYGQLTCVCFTDEELLDRKIEFIKSLQSQRTNRMGKIIITLGKVLQSFKFYFLLGWVVLGFILAKIIQSYL